jgi:hypothetical protein
MINTTCPNCKAPHARKVSLVYEEGYQTSVTKIQENSKSQTILKTAVKTDGVHMETRQTALSSKLAPPFLISPTLSSGTESYANSLSVVAFFLMTFIGFKTTSTIVSFFLFSIIGTIFSIVFIRYLVVKPATESEIFAYEEKLAANKESFEKWDKSYICMTCGNKFIPE